MDCSSSSRVSVEYHDPFNLFSLVSPHLEKLSPLRNLHWTFGGRSTRTIDSLYIDLQPASDIIQPAQQPLPPGLTLAQAAEAVSSDPSDLPPIQQAPPSDGTLPNKESTYAPSSGPRFAVKERRHQIPGLRQAPQLKVLLLRCDDPDSYKVSLRKYVKEWIRLNSPSSRTSTSSLSGVSAAKETHEAFEWMVIHVVLPDTVAATQPKFGNGSSVASGSNTEKQSSSLLWGGRGSSTLFEKLRQDFNSTGKSAVDRICQVRIQKNELPPGFPHPSNPAGPSIVEKDQEILNSWSDVASKFRTLIISSFERRVAQYTEDIKERNDQKSLPGWNFCTYFILKEGLARGYESIGLIEDALLQYGELSLGLDSATSDLNDPSALVPGVNLLSYTEEFQMHYLKSIAQLTAAAADTPQPAAPDNIFIPYIERPIFGERKHYRQMILSNKISLFDFRLYVFARHVTLLLRLSEPDRPLTPLNTPYSDDRPAGPSSNLSILAEICKQTVMFLAGIGAVMREDIKQGVMKDGQTNDVQEDVVENLVASWCYSAADQILQRTSCTSFPFSARQRGAWPGHLSASAELSAHSRPPRLSSLKAGESAERGTVGGLNPGVEEYAAARGELILFQRRIAANLAGRRGWVLGLRSRAGLTEFQDVSLDSVSDKQTDEEELYPKRPLAGLYNPTLFDIMSSLENYSDIYQRMTVYAIKHYQAADRTLTCDELMGDLAMIKFDERDYTTALYYFSKVHALFGVSKWSLIESNLLQMQAVCAKKLNRKDDYVNATLRLLAKAVVHEAGVANPDGSKVKTDSFLHWTDQDLLGVKGLLSEVINFTNSELTYEIQLPLQFYFSNIEIDHAISHFEGRDGFKLKIKFLHFLPDPITFQSGTVQMRGLGAQDGYNFKLFLNKPVTIEPGCGQLEFESFACASGIFAVQTITLKAGRLSFLYDPLKRVDTQARGDVSGKQVTSLDEAGWLRSHRVHCYPRVNSFEVNLYPSKSFRIEHKKYLDIKLSAGWNSILEGEIKVKSRTAGLRLYTADCVCRDDIVPIRKSYNAGEILFGAIGPGKVATLVLPFTLEGESESIVAQFSITYRTRDGVFSYNLLDKVSVGLALDVNVHDCFKAKMMLPNFTVRSNTAIPLCITRMDLKGLDSYEVLGPLARVGPMIIYPGGCVSMQYKIVRKPKTRAQAINTLGSRRPSLASPLQLTIDFYRLDEEIVYLAQSRFESAIKGDEQVSPYKRLLLPIFKTQMRSRLGKDRGSISKIAMRHEFFLGEFEDWDWDLALESLPESIQCSLLTWLADWHRSNDYLAVNTTKSRRTVGPIIRRLDIAVPVPSVPVTCSVRLKLCLESDILKELNHTSHTSDMVVAVGVPVQAKLKVSWTSRWDFSVSTPQESTAVDPPQRTAAVAEDVQEYAETTDAFGLKSPVSLNSSIPLKPTRRKFIYHIDTPADTWVVGGARRRHFTLAEGEVSTFDVTFVPLKVGQLVVPTVEVLELVEPSATGINTTATPTQAFNPPKPSTGLGLSAPPRRSSRSQSPSPAPLNPAPSVDTTANSVVDSHSSSPFPLPPSTIRVEIDDPGHGQMVTSVANVIATTVAVGRSLEGPGNVARRESGIVSAGAGNANTPGHTSAGPEARWSLGTGFGGEQLGQGAGFAGGVLLIETESRQQNL